MDEIKEGAKSPPIHDAFIRELRDYWGVFVNKYGRDMVDLQVTTSKNNFYNQRLEGKSIKQKIETFTSTKELFDHVGNVFDDEGNVTINPYFFFKAWIPSTTIRIDPNDGSSHEVKDLILCFPFISEELERKNLDPVHLAENYHLWRNFYCTRASMRYDEYIMSYVHSHAEIISHDGKWALCCVGVTLLRELLDMQEMVTRDFDDVLMILELVDKWLVTESVEGRPYRSYRRVYNYRNQNNSLSITKSLEQRAISFLRANPGMYRIVPVETGNKLSFRILYDLNTILEHFPVEENDVTEKLNTRTGQIINNRGIEKPAIKEHEQYCWENERYPVKLYPLIEDTNDGETIIVLNARLMQYLLTSIINQIDLPSRYI
jgi:hypothetical protein